MMSGLAMPLSVESYRIVCVGKELAVYQYSHLVIIALPTFNIANTCDNFLEHDACENYLSCEYLFCIDCNCFVL